MGTFVDDGGSDLVMGNGDDDEGGENGENGEDDEDDETRLDKIGEAQAVFVRVRRKEAEVV